MNYSKYDALIVEVADGIGTVTMNQPESRNAVTGKLHDQLQDIWLDIARDERIRVVILTGAGKVFSAGGDIKKFAERAGTVEGRRHNLRTPGNTRRLWQNLLDLEQPVIAAINGDAMGFGANLALMCDTTVMSESARIADSHVKMGIVAGDGGAVIWPLLIGPNLAKDFLLRGRIATAAEAKEIRLVNHVVPADQVLAEARKIAQEMAALPIWAIRWTKLSVNKQIRDQFNLVLDASIAFEMLTMETSDFGEAARAFLEKRKPDFKDE